MSEPVWTAVDDYIAAQLIGADAVLDAALAANEAGGLPPIDVSAAQGKFLNLMVRISGARKILEIGIGLHKLETLEVSRSSIRANQAANPKIALRRRS